VSRSPASWEAMVVHVIFVEGNIGAGKSTLLERLCADEGSRGYPSVRVLGEPVASWHNHLRGVYAAAPAVRAAWSLPMQALAMCTRVEELVGRIDQAEDGSILIVERSPASSEIFADATLGESGGDGDADGNGDRGSDRSAFQTLARRYRSALDEAFRERGAYCAGTIYLRTSPDVCMARVRSRSRRSESGMAREYLEKLHRMHEAAFGGAELVADCDAVSPESLAERVRCFVERVGASMRSDRCGDRDM